MTVRGAFYNPPEGSIPTLDVPVLAGVHRVHLIGIGGAGMRNLAKLFLARGIAVSGSDLKDSRGLVELRDLGAEVWVGHDPKQVRSPDAVVVSSAILERNVELTEARRLGLPVWARAQALAALAVGHEAIAVAGTHGKTTTTSMIATVLERAGCDPSYLIGGDLNESGSGARSGAGELFVFEADESDGSFLMMSTNLGVVTNVDVDHVDFYPGGRPEIEAAFAEFVAGCKGAIVCGDDEGAVAAARLADVPVIRYGRGADCDWRLGEIELGPGGARGVVTAPDGDRMGLELRVDGAHNLSNAVAAIAVGASVGIPPARAAELLSDFAGVHRRFEHRGSARGAEFFDDYGHVPAELEATLEVARRRGPRRLVAVFQPHRYSRTQVLWCELGASLAGADLVVVTDVYAADQDPIPGVTGKLVVDGVAQAAPGTRVVYLPHRHDVVDFLDREVREGDLVITMGCGDVWMVGDAALDRIGGGRP